MKIFLTEFKYEGKTFEGPTILASSFEEAEKQADNYDVIVVGILDTVVTVSLSCYNVIHNKGRQGVIQAAYKVHINMNTYLICTALLSTVP